MCLDVGSELGSAFARTSMNARSVSRSARLHLLAAAAGLSVIGDTGAVAVEPCRAPAGADAGEVLVGDLTARRVESQGSGMGRWASWEHDRWLVFDEPTCRVVGLRLAGGGGSAFASAFFLSPTEQKTPSAEERDALL